MRTRLALLVASALVAFSLQQVRAEDYDDTLDPVEVVLEEYDGENEYLPFRRHDERGPARGYRTTRHEEWRRGPGHDGRMGPRGMRHDSYRGPRHDGYRGMRHDGMGPRGMHHDRGGSMNMGMGKLGMIGPRAFDRLDLTQEQKARLVDVLTENFRARLNARMELMDAEKDLRTLRRAENPNHDAIISANAAVGTARGKLDVEGSKLRAAVRSVLTPAQIETLDEMHDARGPRGKRDGEDGIRHHRGGRPAPVAPAN